MVFAVWQQKQKLHIVFVDLTKAFDTVNHNGLWKILCIFGCPDKLVSLIESFDDGM